MVLHDGDDDAVPGLEQLGRIRRRDEVDRLGGVANEDETLRRSVDESGDANPGTLERIGRVVAQRVHAAMHVRIARGVVGVDRVDDRTRLLRRRRRVEVDERMRPDLALEDRKVGADARDVETRVGGDVRGH